MRSIDGKVVVITGASAGIGKALAQEASNRGAHVVLLARRGELVKKIASELSAHRRQCLGLSADVTNEKELEAAFSEVNACFGQIDYLFANAGFGVEGIFDKLRTEDYRRQFETNVFGVMNSIRAALPALKESSGAIGVVGSANGYINAPGWSAYCMSKHAIRSFCSCVRPELAEFGVSLTHLAPGFISTDFRRTNNANQFSAESKDPVPEWLQMPADKAAQKMLSAVRQNRDEEVIAAHAKLAVQAERHLPKLVSLITRSDKLVKSLSKDAE